MAKILHITSAFSEGGVDSLLLSLLPLIKNDNHNVELLVLDKNKIQLAPILEKQGIKVHIGKYKNVRNPLNIFLIVSYLRKYDIVHVHLFPTQYFVAIAKIFCSSKTRLITTEHTTYNKRRAFSYFYSIEKIVYNQYEKIVCVSQKAKENLDKWVHLNNKTVIIYNGINLNQFETALPYSKQELDLPENSKVLIMVARFFSQKDHQTLIQTMTLLPDNVYLLLCGSGHKILKQSMDLALNLSLGDRVKFLGNRIDIPRLIKSSDIAILSTFYEGFPISLLEYMASGKPTIASDVDGVNELIKGFGILFESQKKEQLAQEIKKLLSNKRYYDEIAFKCKNRSLQFNESSMVEKYNSIYNDSN